MQIPYIKKSHDVIRFATFGLAAVLLVLTIYSLYTTSITLISFVFAVCFLLLSLFWWLISPRQRKVNKAKQSQLRQMAHAALTDPLTGLPNHRAIVDRVEMEMVRCRTSQSNCAILFADIDHLKQINDVWSHAAGDGALITVAQRLRQNIRASDYVGRYSGEEFAILLIDIEQHEALELAERLRLAISDTPCLWQGDETQPSVSFPLTISLGMALYPLDGISGNDLIEMADTAMYIAKRTGRNQVCLPDSDQLAQPDTHELTSFSQYSGRNMTHVLSNVTYCEE